MIIQANVSTPAEVSASSIIKEYDLDTMHISGNKGEDKEITITRVATEDTIHIYTSDDAYLTKIKKCVKSSPNSWKIVKVVERSDGTISGVMAVAPKNAISFRASCDNASRIISEEKKEALRERLKEHRHKRQLKN